MGSLGVRDRSGSVPATVLRPRHRPLHQQGLRRRFARRAHLRRRRPPAPHHVRRLDAFGHPAGYRLDIGGDFSGGIGYTWGMDGKLASLALANSPGTQP